MTTKTVGIEMATIYRARISKQRSRREHTLYLRDKLHLDIASIPASEAPVVLDVKIKRQPPKNTENLIRRFWRGKLYRPVLTWVSSRQTPLTVEMAREWLQRRDNTKDLLSPWLRGRPDPLLCIDPVNGMDMLRQWSEFASTEAMPLETTFVAENTREATAERIREIAASGLVFIDGILHHERTPPVWTLVMQARGGTPCAACMLDVSEPGYVYEERTAFRFPLGRRKEALAFALARVQEPEKFGVELLVQEMDIRTLAPELAACSGDGVANALAGIDLYFKTVSDLFPTMSGDCIERLSELAELRDGLKDGRGELVHDLLHYLDAMAAEGFVLPPEAGAQRRALRHVCAVTKDAVLGSEDLPSPAMDADSSLAALTF